MFIYAAYFLCQSAVALYINQVMRAKTVTVSTVKTLADNLSEALAEYTLSIKEICSMHGACCDQDYPTEEFLQRHLDRLNLFMLDLEAELNKVETIAQFVDIRVQDSRLVA